MKKVASTLVLSVLFILVGCGSKESKLESVTYGMEQNGISLSMEIKYDAKKDVQETITTNTYNYEAMGMSKEDVEEFVNTASTTYKNMSGVTYNVEYGDSEALETLTVVVKKVSKESLPVLFSINANDDGTVSLDTLVKNFESVGFEKK